MLGRSSRAESQAGQTSEGNGFAHDGRRALRFRGVCVGLEPGRERRG